MTTRERAAIFASAMASTRAILTAEEGEQGEVMFGCLDVVCEALDLHIFHPVCIQASRYMKFDGDGIERWAQAHARIMNDEPEVQF